jgi:hypothetical protein
MIGWYDYSAPDWYLAGVLLSDGLSQTVQRSWSSQPKKLEYSRSMPPSMKPKLLAGLRIASAVRVNMSC